jgi:hypothetical protein
MALEEVRRGEYVETDEIDNPECVTPEQFELSTFQKFLLPRIEKSRDEASLQVMAGLREGRSLGDAVFDALESLPSTKTKRLRDWVEEARGTHIYAYVKFRGMSRLVYGLMLTTGGPRDEALDDVTVGSFEMSESIAPYWEFHDALKEMDRTLERESRRSERERLSSLFEEVSMVEVGSKGDYNDALHVMGLEPDDGSWEKPGLYDFRDSPPTYSGTLEDYQRESMKYEAEQAIESLWDSGELEAACETLVLKR